MAGLTSTFHLPCKSNLCKPLKSFSLHFGRFSLPIHAPSTGRCHFICTARTAISSRYGGGGGAPFRKPNPTDVDESFDMSSIRSDTVRLIDEQQKVVGIVSTSQAFQMAEDAELDLVILSPDADPPVVRIMDYKKYRYEQHKKKRDQQKKSALSRMDLKELKMSYNIDVHDYAVRLRAAHKFLKDGDKVKVLLNLKGRENDFKNKAIELIRRFQNDIGEVAIEEARSFRGTNMYIVLVPNKAVVQKSQEPPMKKGNASASEISESVSRPDKVV